MRPGIPTLVFQMTADAGARAGEHGRHRPERTASRPGNVDCPLLPQPGRGVDSTVLPGRSVAVRSRVAKLQRQSGSQAIVGKRYRYLRRASPPDHGRAVSTNEEELRNNESIPQDPRSRGPRRTQIPALEAPCWCVGGWPGWPGWRWPGERPALCQWHAHLAKRFEMRGTPGAPGAAGYAASVPALSGPLRGPLLCIVGLHGPGWRGRRGRARLG